MRARISVTPSRTGVPPVFGGRGIPGACHNRTGNHSGEPQRGSTLANQKKNRSNQKESKMKISNHLEIEKLILKNTYIWIYKFSPPWLLKHSVDHFKTIAVIFGYFFQVFFVEKLLQKFAKQRFWTSECVEADSEHNLLHDTTWLKIEYVTQWHFSSLSFINS